MKGRIAFGAVLVAALVALGDDESLSPRDLLRFDRSQAANGRTNLVRGVVTFVGGIETNCFIIAPQEQVWSQGVVVRVNGDGAAALPAAGDLVRVEGTIGWVGERVVLDATRVDVIRHDIPLEARGAKQADFRRGLLENRHVVIHGAVCGVRALKVRGVPVSRIDLFIDNYTAVAWVRGTIPPETLLGRRVRAVGLARSVRNRRGEVLDGELELSGPDSIEVVDDERVPMALLVTAAALGVMLLIAAGTFLLLWLHGRRARRVMEAVAAERRRMAADLHDTIEQHLAGANLIVAGAMSLGGVSKEMREAMTTLSSVLANAKAEVRSAVLNLRSAGASERTLAESIGDMAASLEKTGVRVRRMLRNLPREIPEGLYHDILLILREATTNAVKHGKAGCIVYTSDPLPSGGWVLRVSNDGVPFDTSRALGPETGHYGLIGMRERALRNALAISWGRDGRWTYVELKSEGAFK